MKNQKFIPEVVIGDGSKSITKATEKIFPLAKRIMCYFHVAKNIKDYFRGRNKERLATLIKEDIQVLQLSRSDDEFKMAVDLFIRKWEKTKNSKRFVKHFTKHYSKGHMANWFEGASEYASTNNGLESKNGGIKKDLKRETYHLNSLFSKLSQLLGYYSRCDPPFRFEPPIDPQVRKEAWLLFVASERTDSKVQFVPVSNDIIT